MISKNWSSGDHQTLSRFRQELPNARKVTLSVNDYWFTVEWENDSEWSQAEMKIEYDKSPHWSREHQQVARVNVRPIRIPGELRHSPNGLTILLHFVPAATTLLLLPEAVRTTVASLPLPRDEAHSVRLNDVP